MSTNHQNLVFFFILSSFLVLSCAERRNPQSPDLSPHLEGWSDPTSPDFHGLEIEQAGTADCAACHGETFEGGYTTVSCYSEAAGCHSGGSGGHPGGWMNLESVDFHGEHVRQSGWDMEDCEKCHGEAYTGGTSGSSCIDCHTISPPGPRYCNVCHGSEEKAGDAFKSFFAPPEDLAGNYSPEGQGVGAHQAHLRKYPCRTCHQLSASIEDYFNDPSHIDGSDGAEVVFDPDSLAATGGLAPGYDTGPGTCSDIYCHGATLDAGGTNLVPDWTDEEGAACGSCHDTDDNDTSPDHFISGNVHSHHLHAVGLSCWDCHPANTDSTAPSDSQHADGSIQWDDSSPVCDACHF